MVRRLPSIPPVSVSFLRFRADARALCLTLALAFIWSFAAAPTAIAAQDAHRDFLAHRPKPLPAPTGLGSKPYAVPQRPTWLASLLAAPAKATNAPPPPISPRLLPPALTQLSEVGIWQGTLSPTQIDAWRQELAARPGAERAALLHLWLGEWQMGHNEQPGTAIGHFRAVQHLTGLRDRLHGLAAYDTAIALFREGAYQQDSKVFYALSNFHNPLRGYNHFKCALWYRHANACAGYHASHARLGIPEPPKLDPLCGAAALAASLQAMGLPSDRKTVLQHCRVTGEGSSLQNLVDAGRTLGVTVKTVSADETGLMRLPKPLIAHVEQDHFVSVIRADARGVSYLCSDCGPWPGGRVDLTWTQWRAMAANAYGVVVTPGSAWDHALTALGTPRQHGINPPGGVQVASSDLAGILAHQAVFLGLGLHVAQITTGPFGDFYICDRLFTTLNCPDEEICCPVDGSGSGGGGGGGGSGSGGGGSSGGPGLPPQPATAAAHGPAAGDPVNLATGEEDYRPGPDIVVYNPIGPSVVWQRLYESATSGTSPDFGPGWSDSYNLFIQYSSNAQTATATTSTLLLPNYGGISFTHPTLANGPTSGHPVYPAVQHGAPYSIEWDYDGSTYGKFVVTRPDRTKWVFGGSETLNENDSDIDLALAQVIDRNGNAININYTNYGGGDIQISSITDSAGAALLTINRGIPVYSITSVTDRYNRAVYYQNNGYENGGYLTEVSQIVPSSTSSTTALSSDMRYTYGYVDDFDQGEPLSSITVPSPTGTGTSTATIGYYTGYSTPNNLPGLVQSVSDSNGNTRTYTTTNGSNTTQVTVTHGTTTAYAYSVTYDGNMNGTTRTDGAGTTLSTATYADPNDPYRPSSVTDANSHTTSYVWDQFGNLHRMTSPNGIVTYYTWAFPGSVSGYPVNSVQQANAPKLGELIQVQESYTVGSTTYYKTPTTYTYYDSASGGSANSGLVETITKPLPGYSLPTGSSGPGSTVTTTFTYDSLGNMTQMVTPGNGTVSSITTTLNYTSDGTYNQTDAINQPLTITDNLGHVTHFRYDSQSNRISMTDALGDTTYFGDTTGSNGYNIANQQILVTYPATGQQGSGNAQMTMSYLYPDGPETAMKNYNESGTKIRETDYAYGSEGETLAVTGSTEPVYYTYDPLYRMSSLTDGSGHAASPVKSTSYFYNTAGYLYQLAYPGAATTTPTAPLTAGSADTMSFTAYDSVGNLKTRLDGRGITTNYAYDAQNTLTDIQYPASASLNVHYDYDGFERKIGMADSVSGDTTTDPVTDGVEYAYDDDDNLTSVATTYNGATHGTILPTWTVSDTFNPDGSRSEMQLANNPGSIRLATTYTYDGAGRMTGLSNPYSEATAWTYQNNNWLSTQGDGNGVKTTYGYNARGLMTELLSQVTVSGTTSTLCQFGGSTQSTAMVYDGVGNRTSMTASGFPTGTNSLNGTDTISYDTRNEVQNETITRYYGGSGQTNPFVYDGVTTGTTTGAGNGTNVKNVSYTYDTKGDNQITGDRNNHTWGFDGNGNPTTYETKTLTFDPENRMTAYGVPQTGLPLLTAGYMGDGLRAWKESANGSTTYYIYDGSDTIAELSGSGSLNVYYTVGGNGLVSKRTGSTSSFFTYDPVGSVSTVTNSTGAVQGDEAFDATGMRVNGYTSRPVDFCGQWGYHFDDETGLLLCGHRYYDPYTARFLNRDPIVWAGGINIYGYTSNNFSNFIDPSGFLKYTPPPFGGGDPFPCEDPFEKAFCEGFCLGMDYIFSNCFFVIGGTEPGLWCFCSDAPPWMICYGFPQSHPPRLGLSGKKKR